MRRFTYILTSLIISGLYIPAKAGDIVAYLSFGSFNGSAGQSYIETYLDVIGKSVMYAKDSNNKFRGKVNIQVSFLQGDSVKMANNYNLLSPEVSDSSKRADFIDVQRYWLKRGKYMMQLTVVDKNNPNGKTITIKQKVFVGFDMDSIHISDVEFLDSYTPSQQQGMFYKNGFNMIPYVYSYYPEKVNQMNFYAEVYNAEKVLGTHQKFVIKYFVESYDTHSKLIEFNGINVKETDTINPILGGFNIGKLPSGNYFMVVQVVDRNNVIRATRSFPFMRHNKGMELSMKDIAAINISHAFVSKFTDKDSLIEDIKSLHPISNFDEKDFAQKNNLVNSDITLLRQYFYNFWVSRNPSEPEAAWNDYHQKVLLVNKEFKSFHNKGYETDRGRVYLQYGVPDQRVKSDMNPNSYPYEIWEYYHLSDGEVDRKFVFYDRDLVSNNYELLHSDARGEIQNRQWQVILNSRSLYGQPSNIDQNSVTDPFGENTLDDFSNPR
ncbi:MAG TPA: GWxTD domain-containing protein [Bacteroidia bacterium]|jgi:GWxTD domain-containing protein|nr:GWxTD domain-containing protein [Bacteroidia bacterium]